MPQNQIYSVSFSIFFTSFKLSSNFVPFIQVFGLHCVHKSTSTYKHTHTHRHTHIPNTQSRPSISLTVKSKILIFGIWFGCCACIIQMVCGVCRFTVSSEQSKPQISIQGAYSSPGHATLLL